MVKVLKKKFKKKKRILTKIILPKIIPIKKEKIGQWCDVVKGRLPYPIECQGNKTNPISYLFKEGVKSVLRDNTPCATCTRPVEYQSWRNGLWDNIEMAIKRGEDLRDFPSPIRR